MAFYDDMQAVASEILAEFKQGIIEYVKITPGVGPIDNPGAPTILKTELDAAARGVQFKYVQNSLAVASDGQVTAAVHPDVVPNVKDFIDLDGIRHKIVSIIPKPLVGTTVAWIFIVRKGS